MTHEDPAAKAVADEAARIIEEAAAAQERTVALGRSLLFGLYDTGLLDLVGRDWVSGDEEEFHFGPLDHRTVRRLITALQGLAEGYAKPVGRPGPGQLAFDFTPRFAQPTRISSVHDLTGVSR